jgi:anti-sigma regulatory factor (Ser/Thr protein kinase)
VPARTAPVTSPWRSGHGPAGQAPARPPRAFLDLGAVLTAPGCARAWTREILWEWRAAELAHTAELVASELVTNSVTHSAGPGGTVIRLILTLDQGELAILVRDDHPGVPMAGQPGEDDEGGRGLLIVEQLSDRCGWYSLQGAEPAKVTWAVISGRGHDRGGPADAGMAGGAPAAALPARPRQMPSPATSMRTPRVVDLEILVRVKGALERL